MAKKKIYTVACSHLDTIWSWDFETTVSKYIYNTLVENMALFKKYPTYTFSFEGAYRYELMEEYYPELFEQMKQYIKEGRWNVTGSAYENGDTNIPSPEALFRNFLIGNSYFDEKFGKRSVDIFLPDCFGFGWALPSIGVHSNLKGFTTQKLRWGSAYGVPFDIGKWYGVDGNYIYASCDPHDYYFTLTKLRDWDFVLNKLKDNEKYNLDLTYIFHGIGDRGGAPEEATVKFVEKEIAKNESEDIEVISATADQIFRDIDEKLPQEVRDNLPKWETELVMQNHGVGGYTSRAIGKRWNARAQELADMAERASVLAEYLGVKEYNENTLEKSWKRIIAHQFHDDTPGTSVQRAYRRSWNDYAMSMNQFSGELEASLCAVTPLIKTDFCSGIPVIVSNSIEAKRTGAVVIHLKGINTPNVRVFDDKGKEVKSQVNSDNNDTKEIVFIADVDSLGVRAYDVRPSKEPCALKSSIFVNDDTLENQKYIVRLNKRGNINSILDKEDEEREILRSPIDLGLFKYTGSKDWPAWEMNYKEADKDPDRIPEIVSVKIAENGPARVALEVEQKDKKSQFKSFVCLTDGCKVVEVYNEIEWQSMRTLCKNRFSFTASNEKATFDLGLGAIERGNMNEKLFEVPAQKWADITDKSGEFGVSVLSECKYGWDKYNDNMLRLTVVHTPKRNYRIDSMQSMMDLGLNRYSYAIYSHKGKVGADTQLEARFFTQPMVAVVTDNHQGALSSNYSFGSVSTNNVIVRCIKKIYHKNEEIYIVRFNEGANCEVNDFTFTLGEGIESATQIYASEEYMADGIVKDGKLVTSFKPYEVKSFALKLKKASVKANTQKQVQIDLPYNSCIITKQGVENNDFEYSIPREITPQKVDAFGGEFLICDDDENNALICQGQVIQLNGGNKVKMLCACERDTIVKFNLDGTLVKKRINSVSERFAAWDLYDFGETAYVKPGHLGFEATHSHNSDGSDAYAKGMYFWVVTLDTKGVKEITLPNNSTVILSCVEIFDAPNASLITQTYDSVQKREFTFYKNFKESLWYLQSKLIWNINDKDDYFRHNNNGKNGKRIEQSHKRYKTRTIDTTPY